MDTGAEILNPTVILAGWELREPVTSATDFLTAMVCLWAFWRLSMIPKQGIVSERERPIKLMVRYFLFMGIGMGFAAITGHLMQAYVPWETKMIGWSFSAIALNHFERMSLELARPYLGEKRSKWVELWIWGHFSLFFLSLCFPTTRNFEIVKLNSTLSLVGTVLPLQFIAFRFQQVKPSRWYIGAVIFGILPAIVFNMEISLSRWFNFHDISHVLMATYSFILFLGTYFLIKGSSPKAAFST